MIELTKDDTREFEKLKTWCAKCPVEAAMRIEQLDSMLSINTNIMKKLKLENEHFKEALERAIDYAKSPKILTEPSGISKILDNSLKGESNETSK